jgi:hypothetical protein
MAEYAVYFSVRLPAALLDSLTKLVLSLNRMAGAKVWSRNKLILKAIQDYYFSEISLPVERRKTILSVEKERRSCSDRRQKIPVTCAKLHTNIDPRQLLPDFDEVRVRKETRDE